MFLKFATLSSFKIRTKEAVFILQLLTRNKSCSQRSYVMKAKVRSRKTMEKER